LPDCLQDSASLGGERRKDLPVVERADVTEIVDDAALVRFLAVGLLALLEVS